MNAYRVTIGQRNAPRLSFESMSPDSCACAAQHTDLCEPNERMSVEAIDAAMLEAKSPQAEARRLRDQILEQNTRLEQQGFQHG